MQHRHGHAALPWTRSICWDMQHGHERAAWTWICNMDIDMQHGHEQGQAACTHLFKVYAHVHASCPCPSCMSMSMLLGQIHAARTWKWSRGMTCSRDMGMHDGNSTQHILGHVVWTWTSSMGMDMQHEHEHGQAACTCPC
jgi:hypothetical protein